MVHRPIGSRWRSTITNNEVEVIGNHGDALNEVRYLRVATGGHQINRIYTARSLGHDWVQIAEPVSDERYTIAYVHRNGTTMMSVSSVPGTYDEMVQMSRVFLTGDRHGDYTAAHIIPLRSITKVERDGSTEDFRNEVN